MKIVVGSAVLVCLLIANYYRDSTIIDSMKSILYFGAITFLFVTSAVVGWNFVFPPKEVFVSQIKGVFPQSSRSAKTKEELVVEALEKSSRIKGLYMTADVANDQGAAATRIRNNLIRIASTTEINGFVIDVKEACGVEYHKENLKKLLGELHAKNIWSIARIVVSSDSSRIEINPDWYITRKNYKPVGSACLNKKHLRLKHPAGKKPDVIFWQDKAGRYWLDPAHPDVQKYIMDFSKEMIDLGFDELQYDYIRFPSDGDVVNAIYPAWQRDKKISQCNAMRGLFRYLNRNLKDYKPDIILSADLFGYASLGIDTGIGQCIESLEDNFDYVSFMVYPSHYYSGLHLSADPARGLPAINYSLSQANANPGTIVYRSLLWARDFFDGKTATSTFLSATSTRATTTLNMAEVAKRSRIRIRPWLEDFFHGDTSLEKRIKKVRSQIEAAEKVEQHGWMLWNASNVYTEGALGRE